MAVVDVERGALEAAKRAFSVFSDEVSDAVSEYEDHASAVLEANRKTMRENENAEKLLYEQVKESKVKLNALSDRIIQTGNEVKGYAAALEQLSAQREYLKSRIESLRSEIAYLQSLQSRAEDDDNSLREQIADAKMRLSNAISSLNDTEGEISNTKRKKDKAELELRRLDKERHEEEKNLAYLQKEHNKQKEKNERLRTALARAESDMNELSASVSSFRVKVLDQSAQHVSGIDQCIRYVDMYMQTNL